MSAALEMQHRLSRAAALRNQLQDGQWHTGTELAHTVGHRFGGALLLVRRGEDGEPAWFVRKERIAENGRLYRYRFTGINPNPPKGGGSWRARALAAERRITELQSQLSALRASSPSQGSLFL